MVSAALEGGPPSTPRRIWAIEGLRAWLAWSVVLGHIVQICDVNSGVGWITQFLATEAVKVFIIISGFVIANVVLERRESYTAYLTRRVFRIFPLYLLLLPVGALTMYAVAQALPYMSWSAHPDFRYDDAVHATIASVEAQPAAHIASHIFLLQGIIPDSLIDNAQTSFLGPAWSLSLEWQFYLIAPLLVWMLTQRAWRAVAIAALAVLAIAARLELFGHFELPSFFPAIGYLFAIGIASRLSFDTLRRAELHSIAIALALLAGAVLFQSIFAIAVWGAFLALILARPQDRQEHIVQAATHALFESRFATAMGARSYAVYLVHWPVVQALAYFIFPLAPLTQIQALLIFGAAVIVATLVLAEILHRFVEKPMIRLGAALARRTHTHAHAMERRA